MGGKHFYTPLINQIEVHHLYPYRYQKVLYGLEVESINHSIDMKLTQIDQCRGVVKLPAPIGAEVISIFKRIQKTHTPIQRTQMELTFSFPHKLLQDNTKTLWKYKKCIVCGNRLPNPGNFRPILEAGYLITKYAEGEAKKVVSIPNGQQRSRYIIPDSQEGNKKGAGSSVYATPTHLNRLICMQPEDLLV